HRARADTRLLHPEPARRAGAPLLRPGRLARRSPRRVRAPADRRGALPARGSVPAPGAALATPRAGHRMSLLETRGLSKHFGGVHAVAGLDLTLAEGEVLGLIGPNGAGKTTAFNLLSGFLAPDAGEIRFRGRSLLGLKPHTICQLGLARTFQIVRPFPRLSVLDNVMVSFGETLAEGPPAVIASHPRVIEAYLGEEYVHAAPPR